MNRKATLTCKDFFKSLPHDQYFMILYNAEFCLNQSKNVCLFDLILNVHSTIFQLCGTNLPVLNQY